MLCRTVSLLVLSGISSSLARGDTLSFFQGDGSAFSDTEDTFITSSSSWAEENFSGEISLSVDQQDSGFGDGSSSSLIRFPDAFGDAEDQIPAEAEIISASIQLYIENPGDSIQVFELLEDWDIDEVSWSQRSDEHGEWGVAGASEHPSHATKVLAEFTGSAGVWTVLNIKQAVKYWAEQPDQNFGVLLQPTGTDGTDISSSESSEVTHRPILIVVFSLPDDWEPGDGEDTGAGEGDGEGGTDTQDTGSEQGGEEGGEESDAGANTDGPEGTAEGGTAEGDLNAGGCSCAVGPNSSGAGSALGLVLLLFWRRRKQEEPG